MVKIYSAPNSAAVHNLKNVLKVHGIECTVRGEHLTAGVGEIPPVEAWVELWLVDEAKADEAKRILSEISSTAGEPWTCSGCGESVDAGFGQCWNCQADHPLAASTDR